MKATPSTQRDRAELDAGVRATPDAVSTAAENEMFRARLDERARCQTHLLEEILIRSRLVASRKIGKAKSDRDEFSP